MKLTIKLLFWYCLIIMSASAENTLAETGSEWILQCDSVEESFRPYLGNGYMGVKIAGEGTNWKANHPHFIAGVYYENLKDAPKYTEKGCAAPKWSEVDLFNGENYFHRNTGKITNYKQVQNLKEGYMRTTCTWNDQGREIDIDVLFYISRANRHLGAIKYSIRPRFNGRVHFKCTLDGDDVSYIEKFDRIYSDLIEKGKGFDRENNLIWLHTETNLGIGIANGLASVLEGGGSSVEYKYYQSRRKIEQVVSFDAEAGREYTLKMYSAVYTSNESTAPAADARKEAVRVAKAGWDKAFQRHTAKLAEIWKSDIVVEGDDVREDQMRIRSTLFNLLQSFPENGDKVGLCPTGLSDGYYRGHIFWDADYWTWTAITLMYRDFAKPLLEYRYNCRHGAAFNAKAQGYKGYKWPWTSGYSGKENNLGILQHQIHICGWVILAQWNYFLLTGDTDWLRRRGYPLMKGTAEFWASRVVWNKEKKRYETQNVVAPLEQGVTNNCTLTAAIIKRTLADTIKAARVLGERPDPKWQEIADKLWIPFDEEKQIYLQYEGYNGHNIDQSSASLMMFPLEYPASPRIKSNMMDYYVPRLNPDQPVVAYATFGVILSELNRKEEAWKQFQRHYECGARGVYRIWIEHTARPTFNYFLQSGGSYLQHVIFGFAGIRIRDDGIHVNPALPTQWTCLRLKYVKIGDGAYDIVITPGNIVEVKRVSGTATVAIFGPDGERVN